MATVNYFPVQTSGSGAPTTATYITQTADAGLSAEQAMSATATGLVWNTTGTGVLTKATSAQLVSALAAGGLYGPLNGTPIPDVAATTIDPATDKVGQYVVATLSQNTVITMTDAAANNGFTVSIVRTDISAFTLEIKRSTGAITIYPAVAPGVPITFRPYGSAGVWVLNDEQYAGT